jgi:indoleamine 2,3-dioxygenase
MEARARPLIDMMLSAIEATDRHDSTYVSGCLNQLAQALQELASMLERMDERCNPQFFYHQIRTLLAGSESMEAAGLPRGVFYDEGDGKGSWRKYRGGSNGQSSLIHFFDAVLGVDHGGSTFHQVCSITSSPRQTANLSCKEMRAYMPPAHARFLDDVEAIANIRAYVQQHPEDREVVTSYNNAIESLTHLRNTHIKLVTRYVILPSRQPVPEHLAKKKNLAALSSQAGSRRLSQAYVGTGGSKLVPFLQGSRDETKSAVIGNVGQ